MPAAMKKQPKVKENVKGLETDEALDKILTQFAEKRSQQILNDTSLVTKDAAPKSELGSKSARRAKRRDLQAGKSGTMMQPGEQGIDENQDVCLNCSQMSCRLTHWLPASYIEGEYECKLCNKPGVAAAGLWHCLNCNWDAHVSCYNRKKEAELNEKVILPQVSDADCPKPSLAWDPLSLSGPHMAIGAGAGVRGVGEVALD